MKHYKKSQSPYFRRRDSFQSPECSTVVEVNPSCESEQSMLEKIIFPDQLPYKCNDQYGTHRQQRKALQEKCSNLIPESKFKEFHDNSDYYKPLKQNINSQQQKASERFNYRQYQSQNSSKNKHQYQTSRCDKSPRQRLNSLTSVDSARNNYENRSINKSKQKTDNYQTNVLKQNCQREENLFKNFNNENDVRTFIDEDKLRQIQQKIKWHQQNNRYSAYQSNHPHIQTAKKTQFRDTMQNQLKKIQLDLDHQTKLKKKQTIIDNISFQKQNFDAKVKVNLKKKNNHEQFSSNRSKNCVQTIRQDQIRILQKCLEKIYFLVLIDRKYSLSADNINLKLLSVQEVKLILGPIFSDVRIKNKTFQKQQFIDKGLLLFRQYNDRETEDIIRLCIIETNLEYEVSQKKQHENAPTRIPGKLLRNSKTGVVSKESNVSNYETIKCNQEHFSKILQGQKEGSNIKRVKIAQNIESDKNIHTKVSKNVYIDVTENTQTDETYLPKTRQKYETQIGLNQKALEMMLSEQRSKRYVSINRENENRTSNSNDQQMQRLKNLEKRFNEHFCNKK